MEVHFAPLIERDPLGELLVEDQGSLAVTHLLVDQPGLVQDLGGRIGIRPR
jgi:hypothetical protein